MKSGQLKALFLCFVVVSSLFCFGSIKLGVYKQVTKLPKAHQNDSVRGQGMLKRMDKIEADIDKLSNLNKLEKRCPQSEKKKEKSLVKKLYPNSALFKKWGEELSEEEQVEAERLFQKYGYNAFLSDRLPLNRKLPDTRPARCAQKKYSDDLPTISVVIIYLNEAFSVIKRAIHSIIEKTPSRLLKEIILVDDHSEDEGLKIKLNDYIDSVNYANPGLIKMVHHSEQLGLTQARLSGWKVSKGDVVAILDAHIEVAVQWYAWRFVCCTEPITEAVAEAVTEAVTEVTEAVTEVTEAVTEVTEVVTEVTEAVTEVTEAVTEVTEAVAEAVTEAKTEVTEAVTEVTEAIAEAVTEAKTEVTEAIAEAVTEAKTEVTEAMTEVTEAITEVTEAMTEVTEAITETITEVRMALSSLSVV
ncbi:polypeptide N-acetylgalactosaminyltransferase 18-like [Boleophthalmus pectinirostris]|uniref:polypeptide N-acetylgalactosaminyltransferase 18-like n=1 Tax=Boleophthalmus pectinirostris TaxID=150288 RepID=UPI0024310AA2|nr:polypeptide N-acetylgalactosaminyltransferase 18-like [Boleophthalmus pectinirostris]